MHSEIEIYYKYKKLWNIKLWNTLITIISLTVSYIYHHLLPKRLQSTLQIMRSILYQLHKESHWASMGQLGWAEDTSSKWEFPGLVRALCGYKSVLYSRKKASNNNQKDKLSHRALSLGLCTYLCTCWRRYQNTVYQNADTSGIEDIHFLSKTAQQKIKRNFLQGHGTSSYSYTMW